VSQSSTLQCAVLRDPNGGASSASPSPWHRGALLSIGLRPTEVRDGEGETPKKRCEEASHFENTSCKICGNGCRAFREVLERTRSRVAFNLDAILNGVCRSKVPPTVWTKRIYQLSEFGACSRKLSELDVSQKKKSFVLF
jgi:hypothetical protein